MILFGCLLAFGAAVAPRVFLVLAWIFSPRWPAVWGGDFLLPLLGIIFLPYTTIMYMLAYQVPRGVDGWDWLWVILGLFLDLWKYAQLWQNREKGVEVAQTYYSSGAARNPTGTTSGSVSGGSGTVGSATTGTGTTIGSGTTVGTSGTGTSGTGSSGTGTATGGTSPTDEPPA